MNIAQLSEQLKDIPQGTLVNYARDPNSVVPQFLALAEIQRRQQLQTAGAGQPPARTVAEDVLDQANPPMIQQPQMAALPENQPGVASLPTGMAQGMAGGGIVAFASGDLVDEEDEDAEMARLFPQKSGINVEEMLAGIRGLVGKLPQSYDAEKAKAAGFAAVSKRGLHPYEAIALDEAKILGLDPRLVQHILYKETGNLKDPATARSHAGAYGPMQLMPGTAKELGVDINDPEQNTRGGVRYFAKMLDQFKDPTLAMAAYNAGPGRVSNMIKSGRGIESLPRETQGYVRMAQGGIASFADAGLVGPEGSPIERYLSENPPPEQESRKLTAAEKQAAFREKQLQKLQASARSSGPAYGEAESVFERLRNPTKFLNNAATGIRNLIPRIDAGIATANVPLAVLAGGSILSMGSTGALYNNPAMQEQYGGPDYGDPGSDTSIAAAILNPANRQPVAEPISEPTRVIRGQGDIRNQENQMYPNKPGFGSNQSASGQPVGMPKLSPNYLPQMGPSDTDMRRYGAETPPTTPEAPIPKSKADEYFDLLAQDIQERAAQAKEEGDINKYLAIMQAGFGMMGGQSPYAFTNIGKGAEQGISTYGALRKQSLDTLKDIGASRLGLAKYEAAREGSKEKLEEDRLYRQIALGQKGSEFQSEQARKKEESQIREEDRAFVRLEHRSKSIEDAVRNSYKNNPLYALNPEKFEAEIQSKIRTLKQTDPLHIALAKRANVGEPINITNSTGVKQYNPKTGKAE